MSKLRVYSVFDSKVGAYMSPFYVRSRGEAMRSFGDAVNDENHPFHKHPGDYTLFDLGEYDEGSGKFTNESTPVSCGVAVEYLRQEAVRPAVAETPQGLNKQISFLNEGNIPSVVNN